MVPEEGVEPTQSKAPADFESAASASSATPGYFENSMPCGGTQASLLWDLMLHRRAGVL